MADNVAITAGSGTSVATDDVGGVHYQKIKLAIGAADTANLLAVGSGAIDTGTPRVTLATDSPGVTALGQSTMAGSLPVTVASDQATFPVYGTVKYVTVDMTAETTAVDAGDVVAATQVVAACTPGNDVPAVLHSICLIDPDDQGAELTLVFMSANTTLGTEDAAPDIDDTEAQTVLGTYTIATTDYKDLGANKVATIRNVGLPVLPASGTDDIYMAIYATATPTYAGGHIYVRLGFI